MKLISLSLKNFRCFKDKQLSFTQKNSIIQGENGSGKTSILEAIYFLSFLRSFRTAHLDDLAFHENEQLHEKETSSIESPSFFVSAQFVDQHDILHELSVGYAQGKKHVVLNKKKPSTLKDLFFSFPVFSITENDLELVKGEPEYRRTFLDGSIAFKDPEYKKILRELKVAIAQRNALLNKIREIQEKEAFIASSAESELHRSLSIWTQALWTATCKVERARGAILKEFQFIIQELLDREFFNENLIVGLNYKAKNREEEDFEKFKKRCKSKEQAEIALGRSLFGAHLDDIEITFKQKNARTFASRGQQKLLIFLIKFAQYVLLKKEGQEHGILLLDDFITDFDKKNLQKALSIIKNEDLQTILTCPLEAKEIFPQEDQVEIINFFK